MYKIAIFDGLRHRLNTGYGQLARGIIKSLTLKGCEVYLQDGDLEFADNIPSQQELSALPKIKNTNEYKKLDLILQVGSPNSAKQFSVPTLMYTQNALGDLISEWVTSLNKVDGLIVPGEFDACVFRKYFKQVYTCPQYIDTNIFKFRPNYRKENPSKFSFMFVGSYGYRKGVDLLLEAFCKAFQKEDDVDLSLYCPTGLETGFNHILKALRTFNPYARINVFGSSYSPAWMSRYYNRADAFITLSRGEGWCMPLHEALLCGKPAIASASTAMKEAFPSETIRLVKVKEVNISSIEDPFGLGLKNQYGQPGNVCYDPIVEDAIAALHEVKANYKNYQQKAFNGSKYILENYSLDRLGYRLLTIISNFLDRYNS